MSVQDTLDERHKQYGRYSDQLHCKVRILEAVQDLYYNMHKEQMTTMHTAVLTDIVTKLTRVAIDMNHIDSWHDIAGFATLTEEMLNDNDNNT